ncbi:MAG: magnesium transporter [Rickettsiales bacterium]
MNNGPNIDDTYAVGEPEKPISGTLVAEVIEALHENRIEDIKPKLDDLLHEDIAELFNQLTSSDRQKLASLIGDTLDSEVFANLEPDSAEDVIEMLGAEKSAEAISEMERDDALHILEDLDAEEQQEILESVDDRTREELVEGLSYPEGSAGRLMRKTMVSIPEFWNVGDTIDHLRSQQTTLPDDFYVIFATDPKFHPVGAVALAKIMQNKREVPIRDIMETDLHVQHVKNDQEDVAYDFRKYGLVEAPVTNDQGRLIGTITVDDIVYVMQEEEEENMMKAGGVRSQDIHDPLLDTAKQRFPWLFINLLTAVAAAAVIGSFSASIQHLVILAVLMPIIASMGGNAGIQAATVTVRALATKRLTSGQAFRTIIKEVGVGMISGLGIASIMVLAIYTFYGDGKVAGIFGIAMIINLMVAGFAGCALPIIMTRLKVDPAITSGVFLTTFTDIVGFFTFLGLATLILL